jgi:diaminopimelate decarboxylase
MLDGRPPAFTYRTAGKLLRGRGLELFCHAVAIERLAGKYGTPLYVYSASTIRERVRVYARAFRKVDHTICYSVKANSNLSLLRMLAGLGCGFDVVSGGELERVLVAARKAAKHVVFSGVGKKRDELRAALRAGILLFNLESESELAALAECATQLRKRACIALRVNPDVPAKTHPYISTGLQQHKFGIPISQARALYAKAASAKFLEVAGVSVHIGSQITEVSPFAAAARRIAQLVSELREDGHRIRFVDVGGGLGIDYEHPDRGLAQFKRQVTRYAEALLTALRGLNVHLLLEPGRSIIGPAGSLITSVVYRKTNGKKRFLIVDAAMNDLIRPALYGAVHEIVPVRSPADGSTETVDIVGPVCETGDFFARDRKLPSSAEGDLLAILDAGAYGMAIASNYNTRPRAAEVLVDGRSVKVIRRRETIRDMLAPER